MTKLILMCISAIQFGSLVCEPDCWSHTPGGQRICFRITHPSILVTLQLIHSHTIIGWNLRIMVRTQVLSLKFSKVFLSLTGKRNNSSLIRVVLTFGNLFFKFNPRQVTRPRQPTHHHHSHKVKMTHDMIT